jgi:hypothetical protein
MRGARRVDPGRGAGTGCEGNAGPSTAAPLLPQTHADTRPTKAKRKLQRSEPEFIIALFDDALAQKKHTKLRECKTPKSDFLSVRPFVTAIRLPTWILGTDSTHSR